MLSTRGHKEGKRGGITANGHVAQWKKEGAIVEVWDKGDRCLMLEDGRVLRQGFYGKSYCWIDEEAKVLYTGIFDACMEMYGRHIF